MYTHHLVKLLLKNKFTRKIFCGVVPFDQIKLRILKHSCSFIVNTHDSSKAGEHWFAVFVPKNGIPEYFDSYGEPPSIKRIIDFLKLNGNGKFIYNTQRIQSDTSINCGKFSLFYLYFRAKGYKMTEYTKIFNKYNLDLNDKIIDCIYDKMLNKKS
jgi:hypothetical protein